MNFKSFNYSGLIIVMFCLYSQKIYSQSIFDTKLEITVRDEIGNMVEKASVTIYKTEADYNEKKNSIETLETDLKGKVTFSKLTNIPYFIDARKDDLDNANGGVKTEALMPKKKNQFTIIIM